MFDNLPTVVLNFSTFNNLRLCLIIYNYVTFRTILAREMFYLLIYIVEYFFLEIFILQNFHLRTYVFT